MTNSQAQRSIMILAASLILIAGIAIGTYGSHRSPPAAAHQACKDALALDDEIFETVATRLPSLDFQGITDHMGEVIPKRHALIATCMEDAS